MKSDVQLRNDVLAELAWEPAVDAASIGVIVHDAVVTLTGRVASYAEKFAAERTALRVAGVKGIAVELGVEIPASHERSDADIVAAVQHALQWNVLVPKGKVQTMVEKGHVTLSGEVAWDYQRLAAERVARDLLGVVAVNNLIRLKPHVAPGAVEKNIREALARQADREARHIDVVVEGSSVTLTGSVHSWAERDAAQGAAWSAPGVTAVIDDLRIES